MFVHIQMTMPFEEAVTIREAAKKADLTVPQYMRMAALKEARGGKS